MRQGQSSKQETKDLMELGKLSKLKEEPHHLSGAYIRSLVKQLTSSRTKDPMNPNKDLDCDAFPNQNMAKFGEGFSETQQHTQQPPQPQQHKKQVRRRLHTSRPYQERLLNMAEARREIVTALKFHRAAMKQASEQQQQQHQDQEQQPQSQQLQPQPHPCFEQEGRTKSRRNPRIYPSSTANYPETLPFPSDFSHHQYPSVPNPYSWTASTIALPPENFDFTLPNQTLGLNLNFQDFNNINTTLYHSSNSPPFYSTSASASASSPSSSSSPGLSVATDQEIPGSAAISQMEVEAPAVTDVTDSGITISGGGGLHAAMDDEEMAEIRSIGEQHQMEWNDTMNLVTSAWWFKFLKTMELGGPEGKPEDDDNVWYHPFDEAMEFPAWLNANESCFQHRLNDYYSEDYFQDPALPCMDIGEIEGIDGEWLA
ncbi:PREDICTED: probable WRKY transcription factor protein 1 isoform X2 [Prunus mume]|uniref:Probable WRKY transcription factor protein 1 isoform X2 n=1 Tax=Prunus mume TaxID=102107 RepID=A0ABM0N7C8_PRUMU|nr:PREDICTED: probable WRKY transcription factor protein 1 isoform X2 [Prunus mume]